MIDKKTVLKELDKVIDPEIGLPITQMKMIDDIITKNNDVTVKFHLTTPFCPIAITIAQDIKNAVSKIKGIKKIKIELRNHHLADQINKEINK